MPADHVPNPEDTGRIDLRELEASADEADRRLLLLSIGAIELPELVDALRPERPGSAD